MNNYKLVISYDGSSFFGYQKTRDRPTVEERLQSVLETILQHKIKLQAASRTDAGVHALYQVVNFHSDISFDRERLLISLNQMLPKSIRALSIEPVSKSFHPTLDNFGKVYQYNICNTSIQSPFERLTSWHKHQKLDTQMMQLAKKHFLGTLDFMSFTNFRKTPHKSTICTLDSIDIITEDERIFIYVKGDHFLYKMVRNIVGTLFDVGSGKISPDAIPEIFEKKQRFFAGVTAPAHGLFLYKVFYNKDEFELFNPRALYSPDKLGAYL